MDHRIYGDLRHLPTIASRGRNLLPAREEECIDC
jgi:hypothetical protein